MEYLLKWICKKYIIAALVALDGITQSYHSIKKKSAGIDNAIKYTFLQR